jgi:signal transduction histidine kinase
MAQEDRDEELRRLRGLQAVALLTAGVAHDFNNLLTVVTGSAESLRMQLDPASAEAARTHEILEATRLAAGLVQRMLGLVRGDGERPAAVGLAAAVAEAADLLRVAAGRAVQVELALDEAAGTVLIDRQQLVHALLNLASNARDAMPRGGTLRVATSPARPDEVPTPRAHAPWGHAVLAVADDGAGMPPEVLERISAPFFTTKNPARGSGLGLASVRRFVSETGGAMDVRSQAGRGTRVSLYLPRVAPP